MSYGTVKLSNERWWSVSCAPHVMIRLKRVFPGVNLRDRDRTLIANTPENCRELAWFLQRFPMDVDPEYLLRTQAEKHIHLEAEVRSMMNGGYVQASVEMALPPRRYQAQAADLCMKVGGLLVGDDVGTGKTVTALTMLSHAEARPALVVTLAHLPRQWEAEVQRFLPGLRTHILRKGHPYDLTKIRRKDVPFPDVIIANYHKLYGWADVLTGAVKAVVFDEVQELRRGGVSNKGQAAYMIANGADYRMGLSATPVYNMGGEMFNVLMGLRPGALGEESEFLREWCVSEDLDRAGVRDPRAFGAYLRDQGLMIRRTRAEIGRELPDLTKPTATCPVLPGPVHATIRPSPNLCDEPCLSDSTDAPKRTYPTDNPVQTNPRDNLDHALPHDKPAQPSPTRHASSNPAEPNVMCLPYPVYASRNASPHNSTRFSIPRA